MDGPHLGYPFSCPWHWGCFHPVGIVNNGARNMVVQLAARVPAFGTHGCVPGGGIAEQRTFKEKGQLESPLALTFGVNTCLQEGPQEV